MENNFECRVCGNSKNNNSYIAKEMMFGSREEFEYIECSNCFCLQIRTIPENIADYYPSNYNSFDEVQNISDNFLKLALKKITASHFLNESKNPFGELLLKKFGVGFLKKIKKTKVNFNSKILDVGSGSGRRLIGIARYGFQNLTGIDPYIENDLFYNNSVKIFKNDIYHFKGTYDLVMLNHVFEHMPNPQNVLVEIERLLVPGGYALIRIPVSNSYSWKKYRTNWVALDAPRHLHLFNEKSMRILVENTKLEITDIVYDSDAYQFWASEQYAKDISLRDEKSYYEDPSNSSFSQDDINNFSKKAEKLNKIGEGDAACFYLRRKI